MPQVAVAAVGAFATWGASSLAATIGLSGLAATAFSAGAGLLVTTALSAVIAPRSKPNAVATANDRFQTFRSGVAPRAVIYGTALVTGPVVYMASTGTYNEWLTMIIPIAGHQIEGYDYIWVNDFRIPVAHVSAGASGTTGSGVGGVTGLYATANCVIPKGSEAGTISSSQVTADPTWPSYNPGDLLVHARLYDGTQTAADTLTVADVPAEWTTDHKLLGVAYMVVKVHYSTDLIPSGISSLSAEVRGKNDIVDVRDSSTGYTTNAALCILDYLQADFGLSIPDAEIDTDFWTAAANICDEDVDLDVGGTTTQKRYTLDGTFKLDSQPIDVVEQLLTACAGTITYVSGAYRLHVGAYDTPTVDLDEDDFAGPIKVTTSWPRAQAFNAIAGTYIDPGQNYGAIAFPQVKSTAAITDDGETVETSLNYPFTQNAARVQRLARLNLLRHRVAGLRAEATFKIGALRVAVWDVIRLTHADFGWSLQPFRVIRWAYDPTTGLVTISLQAEDSAAYTWTYSDAAEPILSPSTSLVSPIVLPTLDAPTLTAGTETNEDGTIIPVIAVAWTAPASPFVTNVEVQWRRRALPMLNYTLGFGNRAFRPQTLETVWQSRILDAETTDFTIKPTLPGVAYDVRIRAIAGNVRGEWTTDPVAAIGKGAGPGSPSGVSVTAVVGGYTVNFTRPTDYDLAAVAVYEDLGAGKVYVGETRGSVFTAKTAQGDFTARTVYVTARNTSGYYTGDTLAAASATYVSAGSATPLQAATADIAANAVTSITSTSSTTDRANSTAGWEDVLTLGTISASAGDVMVLIWQVNASIYDNGSGSVVAGSGAEMNGTDSG